MHRSQTSLIVMLAIVTMACSGGGGGGGGGGGVSKPASPTLADPQPQDPHGLAPLARRIVERVAALGSRFPSMQGANPTLRSMYSLDTSSIPWQPRFEARWDHEHGVSWEADPTYVATPHTARSPNRSRLDPKSGMQLTLWFYEGAWLQLLTVTPFEIGQLRVVTLLSAPNEELRRELEAAIREILESERALAASPAR